MAVMFKKKTKAANDFSAAAGKVRPLRNAALKGASGLLGRFRVSSKRPNCPERDPEK